MSKDPSFLEVIIEGLQSCEGIGVSPR
jgi:hypothetical protein